MISDAPKWYAELWLDKQLQNAIAEIAQLTAQLTAERDGWIARNARQEQHFDKFMNEYHELQNECAEWKAKTDRLDSLLHNVNNQLAVATDLGSKRWQALNDIYLNGEKHNANWCKRKAQEGLGIKNG